MEHSFRDGSGMILITVPVFLPLIVRAGYDPIRASRRHLRKQRSQSIADRSFIDVPREIYTEATLGVYELNDVALLKDVFIWAYERSANRYAVVRQQIGEPDPFRLRHRTAMREVIGDVVRGAMDRKTAFDHIATWAAAHLEPDDHASFWQMLETELMALLRTGNFTRYPVRPAEFAGWEKAWRRVI